MQMFSSHPGLFSLLFLAMSFEQQTFFFFFDKVSVYQLVPLWMVLLVLCLSIC